MNNYTIHKEAVCPKYSLHQTIRAMRISAFLILLTLSQVSASSFAQRLNMSQKQAMLKEIFEQIKLQTGYDVIWKTSQLKNTRPINVDYKNAEAEDILKRLLPKENLGYTLNGRSFVIKRLPKKGGDASIDINDQPAKTSSLEKNLDIDIRGRVVDQQGKGIPGVSITVKGTGKAVITAADGSFSLTGIDEKAIIVISSIGYVRKEVSVSTNMNNIILVPSESKLDEVQIIAYGETSTRLSTGNVSSVKSKDIENSPVNNPLLAIAGRVPGLLISQATGFAGSGVDVQIQGQNSIARGVIPFYVVDGVPYTQSMLIPLSTIQGNSNAGTSSPLAFLNPQDIESIDILKDADATAIYGSRAANGAILITTKKAKAGKTIVSANIQSGFGEVARKIKNLNTEQYLAMRKEAYLSQGLPVPNSSSVRNTTNYDLTLWDQNRYTDWQEELIGGKARYTDAQLTLSGGSANTQVLLGANYHRETTVMPGDFSDLKGSAHISLNHSSTDQRFRFSFNGNYTADKNNLPGIDLTSSAMRLAPNSPSLYTDEGILNWELLPGTTTTQTWTNPLRGILRKYVNNTNNLVASSEISYKIWKSLTLKSTFGYNRLQNDEVLLIPQTFSTPSSIANGENNRGAFYSDKSTAGWNIEPQLTYKLNTAFGSFDFLLGETFQQSKNNLSATTAEGFGNDSQLENILAGTAIYATNFVRDEYKYNAVFGRISYNYQDKYLLNLTGRRDGSSRFGNENRFNNFYGIGAGWIFTQEKWLNNSLSFLSFGKLRASYGTTGNDQIGNYGFLSLYRSFAVGVAYGGGTSLGITGLDNPYLQWEETSKLNLGLDLGFIKDRILLNVNYFRNRSSNQLLAYNLPIITGFSNITQNFPALVQNSGLELSLNSDNFKNSSFRWSTNLNLTIARNKLMEFPGLSSSSYANSLIIGKPINILKTVNYIGVNAQTGRYNFQRPDGTVVEVPNQAADRTEVIDVTPRFYGGLQNSISYKGFTLDFLFQFVKKLGFDDTSFGYTSPGLFSSSGGTGNQPVSILGNYWTQTNNLAPLQRLNPGVAALSTAYSYGGSSISSGRWVDASYIRLKNISLSYNLAQKLANTIHMQSGRVYIQAQNVLTITNFKGLDPENTNSLALPPLRVMTLGVQLTF